MLQDLVVLGANSALPLAGRFSSSFVLRTANRYFLIDAGEGCQMKLGQFKIKRSRISHVFISHMHGDHIFGLPGLITSFNLNNRKEDLNIVGPVGIKKYINVVLEVSRSVTNFELNITELDNKGLQQILRIDGIKISSFPLHHRISTFGYLFEEIVKEFNVFPDKIKEYNLTIKEIKAAKKGKNIIRGDGKKINFKEITYIKNEPLSFAYCSDTIFDPSLVKYISEVDLLYHEATYLHELKDQAKLRMHSTSQEAAEIAKRARVNKLIIGHYSSRYKDLGVLKREACKTFTNTEIAEEGKIFSILQNKLIQNTC